MRIEGEARDARHERTTESVTADEGQARAESDRREPEKKSSGLSLLVLAVPLLACCGLPLLVVAGASILAAVGSPAFIGGAVALASVGVGSIAMRRPRRGRRAACCLPNDLSGKPSESAGDMSANGRTDIAAARRGEVTQV